jgi:hypothetical protein
MLHIDFTIIVYTYKQLLYVYVFNIYCKVYNKFYLLFYYSNNKYYLYLIILMQILYKFLQ